MATAITHTEDEPTCPICLGLFNVPRQLPCAHTFCQSCLQSYITSKAIEHEKKRCIECPVCRKTAAHIKQNKSIREWASLFPVDTVIQSMLPTKSKVDRVCDACSSDGSSVTATGFCAVCEEAMCDDCLKFHRKQKMSKAHSILTMEELLNNPQNVMKFAEGFKCFDHDEDLKLYCNNHKIVCCGICYFESHNTCSEVRKLKEELPVLLLETKPSEIIEELKNLETHLKTFIDIKESNMNDLESQVNGLTDQIREMRMKINTALDELEMKVKMEGKRINKEVAVRTQEENHQCLSLIHAVRNSQLLCETVHKYGNDLQNFLTAVKVKSQLALYYSQVKEKYERTDMVTVQVKFTPLLGSILSLASSDIGKLVTLTTGSSTLSLPGLRKATKECQVELVETFKISGNYHSHYTGITILPRDRVMLVDRYNSQCILLDNSHQVVTTYTLTEYLCDICVMGDEEVAVSVCNQNKIQILSVRNDVISPVRAITTKYMCYGITAAGKGEMVVVGDCGNDKHCWSLIRDGREVNYSDKYDSPSGRYNYMYIALNNSKTRIYVTVCNKNSLLCFNMEGKKQYTYSPDNLKCPLGVAVDRDDNIYVVGKNSHNIHQLSPEGCIIQVITTGVPQYPWAISFDNSRDTFNITNVSEKQKLHIYQLK